MLYGYDMIGYTEWEGGDSIS